MAQVRWVAAGELEALDFAWKHDRGFVRAALTAESGAVGYATTIGEEMWQR